MAGRQENPLGLSAKDQADLARIAAENKPRIELINASKKEMEEIMTGLVADKEKFGNYVIEHGEPESPDYALSFIGLVPTESVLSETDREYLFVMATKDGFKSTRIIDTGSPQLYLMKDGSRNIDIKILSRLANRQNGIRYSEGTIKYQDDGWISLNTEDIENPDIRKDAYKASIKKASEDLHEEANVFFFHN